MESTPHDAAPDDEFLAAIIARRHESEQAMAAAHSPMNDLYDRHARSLLAFLAARVERAYVHDLHQDVWMRVWRHLPERFHGGKFRAWLFEIARNALIDHARKRRAEPLAGEETLPDPRDDRPDARMIEQERMAILTRCLDGLDAVSAALVRARLGGEDYASICGRLGLKPERAHKLFHQAKDRLKQCVERAQS